MSTVNLTSQTKFPVKVRRKTYVHGLIMCQVPNQPSHYGCGDEALLWVF